MQLSDAVLGELKEKAYALFREEGTYLRFMMYAKRGATGKMHAMLEDLLVRYGQDLEGGKLGSDA